MARPTSRSGDGDLSKVPAHPALLDLDLTSWAGRRIAAGGRRDALLGRVDTLHLSLDGRTVEAQVRGNGPLPYRVRIHVDGVETGAGCTCEPAGTGPCRHAVAALEVLRFPAPTRRGAQASRKRGLRSTPGHGRIIQPPRAVAGFVILGHAERTLPREDRIARARAEELRSRQEAAKRERSPVVVVPAAGMPRYQLGEGGPLVTLHGPGLDLGCCSCDDYASNELSTCKHVERVRAWFRRQRKERRPRPSRPIVAAWWSPRSWIDRVPDPLAEIRVTASVELPPAIAAGLDAEGFVPRGTDARAAREALDAMAKAAAEHGASWDFDPALERRLAEAFEVEQLDRTRRRATDQDVWEATLAEVRLTLHSYQVTGARFLARTGRAFLADDMGLGKTVQAVVAARLLARASGVERVLVVCPASLKHQWRAEIEKIIGERALVVDGSPERRAALYRSFKRGFLVLNYELVLRDLKGIRAAAPELVILDEAQRIKNWSTRTARAVKRLSSPHAFVLTGTPLENRLHELHSIVEFLHPRASGPRWRLMPFHAVADAQGQIVAYEGLDVLRRRLEGFFLRRERGTVLDQLPPRTDNTFWAGMSSAQRRPYRRLASIAARLLSRGQALSGAEVGRLLRVLTGMRMLCNGFAQYAWDRFEARLETPPSGDPAELRAFGSPKLEEFVRVLEDLLDESQEKIVVFSQWERMLRLAEYFVRPVLEARELRAGLFHGGLSSRARGRLLEDFGSDPAFRVLFSTDSGGLGLNLQDAASIVVHLEVPWNPAVLEQRIGRVHRFGQRRSVQVLHFVTADAIEERVRKVVENKRALFHGLFTDEADAVELAPRAVDSTVARLRLLLD